MIEPIEVSNLTVNNSSAFRLDGHVALVTGGTRGLGKEVAFFLARAGAGIAMHFHQDSDTALKAFDELQEFCSNAFLVQGDVTDRDSINRIFQQVLKELGPIDIVVMIGDYCQTGLPSKHSIEILSSDAGIFVKKSRAAY